MKRLLILALLLTGCTHGFSPAGVPTLPIAPLSVGPDKMTGWTTFPFSGTVTNMVLGHDGAMWATMGDRTVSRIDPFGNQTFYKLGGEAGQWLAPNPDLNMYVEEYLNGGPQSGGTHAIAQITPQGQVTDFPISTPVGDTIGGIVTGSDANIWMVVDHPDTDHFDTYAARMTVTGQYQQFPSTIVGNADYIVRGPDKNVWTRGGIGNGKTAQFGFIRFNIVDGTATEFVEPGGNLWVGTDEAFWGAGRKTVYRFDPMTQTDKTFPMRPSGLSWGVFVRKNLYAIGPIGDTGPGVYQFSSVKDQIVNRIASPGYGPMYAGPSKQIWQPLNGLMYVMQL